MVETIKFSHGWLTREHWLVAHCIETKIMIQSKWIQSCLTFSIFLSLIYGAVIEDRSQRALSIFNIVKVCACLNVVCFWQFRTTKNVSINSYLFLVWKWAVLFVWNEGKFFDSYECFYRVDHKFMDDYKAMMIKDQTWQLKKC